MDRQRSCPETIIHRLENYVDSLDRREKALIVEIGKQNMALSDLQNQLEADQSGGGEIVDGAIDDLIMRSGDETERILLDLKNEVEEAKAKAKSSLLELEAFRKRYDGIEKENKALRVRLQDKGKFDSVRGGWRDRARLNNPSSFTAMPNQRVVSLGGEGPDSTIGLAELLKERDILITDLAAAREEIEVLRSGNLGRKDDRERIDELGKQLVSEKAKSKDLIEKHAPLPPLIKTLETLILTQKASLQAKDRQIHDLRQKQIDYPSAEKKFRAQIQEQQTMITSLQAKVQAEESAAKKSMDGMLESMRMMSTKVASFEGILKAKEERKQIEGSGSQDRGGEGREVARIPSSAEQAKIL